MEARVGLRNAASPRYVQKGSGRQAGRQGRVCPEDGRMVSNGVDLSGGQASCTPVLALRGLFGACVVSGGRSRDEERARFSFAPSVRFHSCRVFWSPFPR